MSITIEIVRFEVPPERAEELIGGHLDARRAIRTLSPPGTHWSRLARLDERRWVEVVAWPQRSVFDRALELSPDDPTAGAWFALAEPGFTIVIGEAGEPPDSPPPRKGELELVWSTPPATKAPEAANGAVWSLLAETDGRTLHDDHESWTDGAPASVRISVQAGVGAGREPAGPGQTHEAGPIAHAVDDTEEREAVG
jgi:hypothetical protein